MNNTLESHECTADLIFLLLYNAHINCGKSLFPKQEATLFLSKLCSRQEAVLST